MNGFDFSSRKYWREINHALGYTQRKFEEELFNCNSVTEEVKLRIKWLMRAVRNGEKVQEQLSRPIEDYEGIYGT